MSLIVVNYGGGGAWGVWAAAGVCAGGNRGAGAGGVGSPSMGMSMGMCMCMCMCM